MLEVFKAKFKGDQEAIKKAVEQVLATLSTLDAELIEIKITGLSREAVNDRELLAFIEAHPEGVVEEDIQAAFPDRAIKARLSALRQDKLIYCAGKPGTPFKWYFGPMNGI